MRIKRPYKSGHTSDREYLQARVVERTVECARGNKRKYGFRSECAVLRGKFGSK